MEDHYRSKVHPELSMMTSLIHIITCHQLLIIIIQLINTCPAIDNTEVKT